MKVGGAVSSLLLWSVACAVVFGAVATPSQQAQPTKVNFSREVLPILSDKCFKCHGPDAESRKAGMRLDTAEGAYADRHGNHPIVPGKPANSLVYQRITSKDDPMPPPLSGKTLSKLEIDTLTRWIEEGGNYGKIWSFEPLPKSVPVPNVKGDWPRDDLDRFVLDDMTKNGLSPSKPASRNRWLRRVTLDLTGLPPTEAEISAFGADKRPDAFERVADRLLASSHFGERVAVDWLDAARYSDSYGYQSDLLMPTWPYRDWVVKAFNENLPYDRFITDQVAGDLLDSPTRDERLATAFNRLHRQSNEGGSIALEFKTAYAEDRVDTFGTAVLGLTVGCARCHDHKFDPITQKEYFQLFAYFNSIDEYGLLLSTEIVPTPSLLLPTKEQETRLNELHEANTSAAKALADAKSGAKERYRTWIDKRPVEPEIPGLVAKFSLDKFDGDKLVNDLGGPAFGSKLMNVELAPGHSGQSVAFDGDNGVAFRGLAGQERWDAFTWSFWIQSPMTATGPEILLHRTGGTDVGFCGFDLMVENGKLTARVMRHWPGNAVAVRAEDPISKNQWTHVAWSWDGSGRASGLKLYVDGAEAETEVLADSLWKKINAYGDLGPSGGDWAFGQRFRDAGFKGGRLDDVVFASRALSGLEVAQLFDGKTLVAALKAPESNRDGLIAYYESAYDAPTLAAQQDLQKAQSNLANYEEGIREISVMEEARKKVPAYLLARGQYDAPRSDANRVHRDVPKSLPPLPTAVLNNRLTLARWATSPEHPLTARVAVNRFWQMLFGTGFVETSENFGSQGAPPSHPELLDFLSRRFVDSGWDVKKLFRGIVLSATYRQDSVWNMRSASKDPHNVYFSRGPSGRLSAEMIRDTVLAASGLLNPKSGGPPVNPYQPAGIWQENNTMSPAFVQSKGADLYCRSLFSTWKRTTPVPSMMLFDATSREACTVRRPSTDTPLQALVLLNDVQFVEAARALAELVLKEPGSDKSKIAAAFVRLAGRAPDSREADVLIKTLAEQRAQFQTDPGSATRLISFGDSKADPSLHPVDLAAMTVTVQTVMNSDAVIWKR